MSVAYTNNTAVSRPPLRTQTYTHTRAYKRTVHVHSDTQIHTNERKHTYVYEHINNKHINTQTTQTRTQTHTQPHTLTDSLDWFIMEFDLIVGYALGLIVMGVSLMLCDM